MELLISGGERLLRVSGQAAVLVGLVLTVQWLFRQQLTPRWRCALWWLVVVRLLLPVSVENAASIFNLTTRVELPHTSRIGSSPVESHD